MRLRWWKEKVNNKNIEYLLYKKSGLSQRVLIDPKYRNIKDLEILGEQLRKENETSSFAWISVFDDSKAADMFNDQSDWSKEQEEYYFKHFIAQYNKNINTKINEFTILLSDNEDGNKKIKYTIDTTIEYQSTKYLEDYIKIQNDFYDNNTPIYHYTSLESLINILKTKSLWATNCQYLNDKHEAKYFSNILKSELKYELTKLKTFNSSLTDLILNIFDSNDYKNHIDKSYIISFTKSFDSLPMWKYYGKNGIIMEFETAILNKIYLNKNFSFKDKINNKPQKICCANLFNDVIYDYSFILFFFKDTINNIIKKFDYVNSKQNRYNEVIDDFLLSFRLCFLYKDESYSFENEKRMVFVLNDNDVRKFEKFKVKNNLVIPYIDVLFEENGKLPLKKIIINPEQKDEMYKDGIEKLLKSHNYNDVIIEESKSSIRI
jgi:hypothetical protein